MKQGERITKARAITLSLVLIAVLASLAFDVGIGTPSAFGMGQFFLLCPLGAIESLIASKSLIPITLISLAVVLVLSCIFGRAWCAWGCPAPVIRRFFKREPKRDLHAEGNACATCSNEACGGGSKACGLKALPAVLRLVARDTRTWALVIVLVVALVAGMPLFCLVCPVGLTFGTVASLWNLIVNKQVTASALVFPAALLVELVLYRKWCMSLCPIAGLLNIFGHAAKTFRPHVEKDSCLRGEEGKHCSVCTAVCPEGIDLHAPDASLQLGECTRCGECIKHCPTNSIRIEVLPRS